jgi:hypothetical protein
VISDDVDVVRSLLTYPLPDLRGSKRMLTVPGKQAQSGHVASIDGVGSMKTSTYIYLDHHLKEFSPSNSTISFDTSIHNHFTSRSANP